MFTALSNKYAGPCCPLNSLSAQAYFAYENLNTREVRVALCAPVDTRGLEIYIMLEAHCIGGVATVCAHVILYFHMLLALGCAVRAAPCRMAVNAARMHRFPTVITRKYSTKDEQLSKEQTELLNLLRSAAQQEKLRQDQVSLGLAGKALSEGAAADNSRVSRWTGEGKKWSDISAGQKGAS